MIPKLYKEIIRYVIVALIMTLNYQLSIYAYELEQAGKLTMQFAGVVASSYGALGFVLKFIFNTAVQDTPSCQR